MPCLMITTTESCDEHSRVRNVVLSRRVASILLAVAYLPDGSLEFAGERHDVLDALRVVARPPIVVDAPAAVVVVGDGLVGDGHDGVCRHGAVGGCCTSRHELLEAPCEAPLLLLQREQAADSDQRSEEKEGRGVSSSDELEKAQVFAALPRFARRNPLLTSAPSC